MPAVHRTSSRALDDLTVGLSRVLFPIVVLLGLNGLLVGILNAYDHFTIPAIAPLVWNLVIIAGAGRAHAAVRGRRPDLRVRDRRAGRHGRAARDGFPVLAAPAHPDPDQLPLARPADPARAAADAAGDDRARADQLQPADQHDFGFRDLRRGAGARSTTRSASTCCPQGMFCVAVATVLFPALSRLAARQDCDGLRALQGNGMRQIALLLIPAAAVTIALAGADHAARLPARRVRRRVDRARSPRRCSGSRFSLPFAASTCCSRARSSPSSGRGRRPRWPASRWPSTSASRAALYGPLGIAGVVIGTVVGERGDDRRPGVLPAPRIGGLELAHDAARTARRCSSPPRRSAASPTASGTCSTTLLGAALLAQIVSVGGALARRASAVYAGARARDAHPRGAPDPRAVHAPAAAPRLVTF